MGVGVEVRVEGFGVLGRGAWIESKTRVAKLGREPGGAQHRGRPR